MQGEYSNCIDTDSLFLILFHCAIGHMLRVFYCVCLFSFLWRVFFFFLAAKKLTADAQRVKKVVFDEPFF